MAIFPNICEVQFVAQIRILWSFYSCVFSTRVSNKARLGSMEFEPPTRASTKSRLVCMEAVPLRFSYASLNLVQIRLHGGNIQRGIYSLWRAF
jgi:hypothetical protein